MFLLLSFVLSPSPSQTLLLLRPGPDYMNLVLPNPLLVFLKAVIVSYTVLYRKMLTGLAFLCIFVVFGGSSNYTV